MKKQLLLLSTITFLLSFTVIDNNDYFLLFENSSSIKYFKNGKHNYYEYFLDDKEKINGIEYYVELRNYSWGDIDTTYYRKGEKYFLHFDKKKKTESIVFPIKPELGEIWYESDNSWKYEIISVNDKFKTRGKKYKDCVVVKSEQLTNRDKNKKQIYYIYYSKGYGYVGNGDSKGRVISYLSEMKLNTKIGDKVGVK